MLALLCRSEVPLTVADACRLAKCAMGPIAALRQKGYVRAVKRRMNRFALPEAPGADGADRRPPLVLTGEQAEVLEVIGHVEGRNVLIVDDFTISGGTLVSMANVLKARGAKDIYACVSHGVLSRGAAQRIGESAIKRMFMTDTIEPQQAPFPPNIEVVTVARLFGGEALKRLRFVEPAVTQERSRLSGLLNPWRLGENGHPAGRRP